MMDLNLNGRTAIVTGAASGIGRATALALAHEGVSVALADIDEASMQRVLEEMEGHGIACTCDVRHYEQTEATVHAALEAFGRLDILINCAGGAPERMLNLAREFREVPLEVIDYGLDLNLRGALYFCRAAIGTMIDQKGGVIINLGSVAGCVGTGASATYSAAKGGIISMTRALGIYGGPRGVRCCCVSPGPVLSRPAMSKLFTYLGRAAQPAEIADLITYLCSERASFISGHNYVIDGSRCWGTLNDALPVYERFRAQKEASSDGADTNGSRPHQ